MLQKLSYFFVLRSFAILAWCLPRLRLEKADEVLGILKAEVLTDLRDG